MSKMTKTQVVHLQDRLRKALNTKVNETFIRKAPPTLATAEELTVEVERISKVLKCVNVGVDYHIQQIARNILNTPDLKTKTFNDKVADKSRAYRKLKESEIDGILDAAILGDSTEALEALKAFQAGL
jgi:phenylalanyl-tRNA synthetase beta subunit